MKRTLTALSLCLLATSAFAGKFVIYSPDQGVLCDKKSGFCADSEGISMAYTKEFLGDKAEQRMMDQVHAAGGVDNFDATTFTLSNGVHCETKEKKCTVSKISDKPDPVANTTLFGK